MRPRFPRIGAVAEGLLFLISIWLCWSAASWALQPGSALVLDESGNLIRFLTGLDWTQVTLLPNAPYNDRPVGFVLERLLYDHYGFDYVPQLRWFLLIHAANLMLGYALFRRLGVSRASAIGAIGAFGALSTTSMTITYLGAVFDVGALFFILSATLLFIRLSWSATVVSVVLYGLAVRTKEFAIVLPVLWAFLAMARVPEWSKYWKVSLQRLILPFLVMSVFAVKYASMLPKMMASIDANNPYRMKADPAVIWESLVYYTKLILALEDTRGGGVWVAILLAGILLLALVLRNMEALIALAGFLLLLLPVAMLPGIRTPFYAYAPQFFLILAVALVAGAALARFPKWGADVGPFALSAAALWGSWTLQHSSYFKDRVAFMTAMRSDAAKALPEGRRVIGEIPGGSKIFVSSGGVSPWLLVGGPCLFFQLEPQLQTVTCTLNQPLKSDSELIAAGYTLLLNYDAQHHMSVRRLVSGAAAPSQANSGDPNPGSRP